MESAEGFNERGLVMEEEGAVAEAEAMYRQAIRAEPRWSVPHYNLGLLYKRRRDWVKSLRCNRRAVELDPDDVAAWWNLGIAATALGDWREARRAWRSAGVGVPPGEGPLEMDIGPTPVRINPEGEVVWCWRLDPARAVIRNIPLPESRHRFGDLLLHDGAPNGYRTYQGEEVPVFDELQIIEASPFSTYEVVIVPTPAENAEALIELAMERDLGAEDWSTINMLYKLCSEGRPHEHHQRENGARGPDERRLVVAAHTEEEVRSLLARWTEARPDRDVRVLHCLMEA